jgi:hypothetical protein
MKHPRKKPIKKTYLDSHLKNIEQSNFDELYKQGAIDSKLLKDEYEDLAFVKFQQIAQLITQNFYTNALCHIENDYESLNDLDEVISKLAKWFNYEVDGEYGLWSFCYDFRERMNNNQMLKRPLLEWV